MTDLKKLKTDWNELGETDPFWAILSNPLKKGNKWNPGAFFKTGKDEISFVIKQVQSLNISLARNRALDFGCGVGRLTQALCEHFDQCYGVDIAYSMIRLAKKYNRYGKRCRYLVNDETNLNIFEKNFFDFIYSTLTLQHMAPQYSKKYLKEFLRVLAPGGVLIFQIPSEPTCSPSKYVLPNEAFKAQITVEQPVMTPKCGMQTFVSVMVRNMSNVTWPVGASINLGNHWLDINENLLLLDDGRVALPKDLRPKEVVTLSLPITFPKEAGDYILELDMVQEMVAWFKDKGSQTAKILIKVGEGKKTQEQDKIFRVDRSKNISHFFLSNWPKFCRFLRKVVNIGDIKSKSLFDPKIDMYGIHRDAVLDLIGQWGGRIITVQEDCKAGPEWRSYTYYVTK